MRLDAAVDDGHVLPLWIRSRTVTSSEVRVGDAGLARFQKHLHAEFFRKRAAGRQAVQRVAVAGESGCRRQG